MTADAACVVIPAHNESRVIARCLKPVLSATEPLRVVVVCNGCTDDTADVARGFTDRGVEVVEVDTPSKAAALNRAEELGLGYPRLFVDADVEPDPDAIDLVIRALRADGALAGRPPVQYSVEDCSPTVRSFYRARSRTPYLMNSLWGAGFYAVSEQGRTRWSDFPSQTPDDLYVASRFAPDEVVIVDGPAVMVHAPRTPRALLRTLRRVYRRPPSDGSTVAPTGRSASTVVEVLTHNLDAHGLVDAAAYLCYAAFGRIPLTTSPTTTWERDETTR